MDIVRVRIKSIIYRAALNLLRVFWRLIGGRRISAFGHEIIVSPDTTFPSYRKLKLPKGGCRSEIVRYADYVQMHAICNYLSSLEHSATVVEVGAHHGAYAVIIGKLLKKNKGKLIAIEPNEESFRILKQNIRLNDLEDIVFCEQIAILDREGTISLAPQGSQTKIINNPESGSIIVKSVTIKNILNHYALSALDLLLIDVEGAELPVLRSVPWGTVSIRKIYCELHPYAWKSFGYNNEDVKQFLLDHHFRCMDMYLKEHTEFESDAYVGPTLLFKNSSV